MASKAMSPPRLARPLSSVEAHLHLDADVSPTAETEQIWYRQPSVVECLKKTDEPACPDRDRIGSRPQWPLVGYGRYPQNIEDVYGEGRHECHDDVDQQPRKTFLYDLSDASL